MSTDGRNDVTIPQSCSDSATAVAVLTAGFGYKTNGRMPPWVSKINTLFYHNVLLLVIHITKVQQIPGRD